MENIGYISLSHQEALKQQMTITANNIANMSTPGYKSKDVIFENMVTKAHDEGPISMVEGFGTFRRLEQGPLSQTHNDLDFALQGNAYFTIDTPAGVKYTRAGNFVLNETGQLTTPQGFAVQGADGPIVVPTGTTQIEVTEEGTISTENGAIGSFNIVRFENEQSLKDDGNGLFNGNEDDAQPADDFKVIQGALESSNVQPIVEMTRMMEVLRMYQATNRMMQNSHDLQRSTIRKLTEIQ